MLEVAKKTKIDRLMEKAIGLPVRVRYEQNTTVKGVIREITFIGWHSTGEKKTARFKIKLLVDHVDPEYKNESLTRRRMAS